uniref:F-box domain-containing protein n=1 Tax=Tanacetum cinerariifolium TaxID=118510 RepID=A0A699GMP6_TANCI|nr:hypothetical protein [Tanacetum cinerariifolium]
MLSVTRCVRETTLCGCGLWAVIGWGSRFVMGRSPALPAVGSWPVVCRLVRTQGPDYTSSYVFKVLHLQLQIMSAEEEPLEYHFSDKIISQKQQGYPEMDFFSNLPSDIIEIILCFLTTQEAARTSLLSKEWRYRWIKIPKVTFIEDMFQVSADLSVLEHTIYTQHETKMMFIKPKFVYAINQVLSMHEGPIYEFALSMKNILFETKQFQHLLSNCPLLKTVTLADLSFTIEAFHFRYEKVPRELPTALIHLKYLSINGSGFINEKVLSILVLLINSSPNLEKLKIENTELGEIFSCCQPYLPPIYDRWSLEDYADIWLEHLNELHISHFINWGNELDIVKLILAKSPVLRKVIYHEVSYEEGLQISEVFLSCPRASPVVEIIF